MSLTKNEYRILLCLMQSKGRVVSREKLMERLWETDSFVDENTLTVNIGRLRKNWTPQDCRDSLPPGWAWATWWGDGHGAKLSAAAPGRTADFPAVRRPVRRHVRPVQSACPGGGIPVLLCAVAGSILLAADYRQALRRHRQMERVLRLPDEIAASLPPADTVEREDYRQLVALLEESRRQIQSQAQRRYGDMVDYYTLWAHQIKTPIASMRLTLQNEDSDLARSLSGDLMRVEQYVEMVLVFLRLDSSTTDYVIRRHSLDDIVRPAVRRFAGEFIRQRLRLEYQPLDYTVVTDGKWLGFVVEQVLSNALKYTASGSVTIAMDGDDLCIRDTGMGIAAEDLPRIFEQGFTGVNGRRDRRASGIGLYLCRRICGNLGHTIRASSVPNQGTEIRIGLGQKKTLPE